MASTTDGNSITTIIDLHRTIKSAPYRVDHRLKLAKTYQNLRFPDLAAGEAYMALLLIDEINDEFGDDHEHAIRAAEDATSYCRSEQKYVNNTQLEIESRQLVNVGEDMLSLVNLWSSNA